MSINRYEDIIKDTLHVAGTKLFGGVVLESEVSMKNENFSEIDELIEVREPILTANGETLTTESGVELATYYKVYRE